MIQDYPMDQFGYARVFMKYHDICEEKNKAIFCLDENRCITMYVNHTNV